MGFADIHGRARVAPRAPRAFGVCDSCGEWRNRVALIDQYEYRGSSLADTGFRYCRRCLSKPQDQLRPVILPRDPPPVFEARVEYFAQDQNLNSFTQVVGSQGTSLSTPLTEFFGQPAYGNNTQLLEALFYAGYPVPILVNDAGTEPLTDDSGNVLVQDGVNNLSGTINASGIGQQIVAANVTRNYLLIYAPTGSSFVAAAQNMSPVLGNSAASLLSLYTYTPPSQQKTVIIGSGEALFQSSPVVNAALVWGGAVFVLGLIPGAPFWAWEGINVTVRSGHA